jgi:anti-sigma regulatory factor (Ser/Thr protein kinase)
MIGFYAMSENLARFLEPLLQSHQAELTGEKGLLYQALANAFRHAHHEDRLKPITVSVLLGRTGLIIRVSDCGRGFNVPRIKPAVF